MTNQVILTKAIGKAIDGGWSKFGKKTADWRVLDNEADNTFPGYEIKFMDKKHHWFCTSSDIIFSHDFAKALWGEKFHMTNSEYGEGLNEWEYHLQQMVIADDPIAYLGAHLDG